jgi:N-acetylneuraminate lyase
VAHLAAAAPATPFYHYDIPALTGMSHSMPEFLESAPARIPTLAGLKFTNPDLMAYQYLLRAAGGKWDVPFGVDEHLLGALAMGARGAVGSGFNFAAPIYQRLIKAFAVADFRAAREEQFRGVQIIKLFVGYGYMGAAKATMQMLGVDVGPARLPNSTLDGEQTAKLRGELEAMGYFEWIR